MSLAKKLPASLSLAEKPPAPSFFIHLNSASPDPEFIGVELRPGTKPGVLYGIPMIPGTESVIIIEGVDSNGNVLNVVTHPTRKIASVKEFKSVYPSYAGLNLCMSHLPEHWSGCVKKVMK